MSFTLDRRAGGAAREDARVRARRDSPGGFRVRPRSGAALADPPGGRPPGPLQVGALRRAVGGPDRPVAADPDGRAVLGLRRNRALDCDARARSRRHPPGRDRRAARALGARVLRHAGRHQARGPRRDRAERRQRHPLDPDASPQGRRRLGDRRPEGVHRERRHRRCARGRGHGRSGGRSPRARGCSSCRRERSA